MRTIEAGEVTKGMILYLGGEVYTVTRYKALGNKNIRIYTEEGVTFALDKRKWLRVS